MSSSTYAWALVRRFPGQVWFHVKHTSRHGSAGVAMFHVKHD